MQQGLSRTVIESLKAAGWVKGRCVSTRDYENLQCTLFPVAKQILQQFAGLHVGKCGPGRECATSDINIDPRLATHLTMELVRHERTVGTHLFVLGEIHRGQGYIVIDENGKTYLLNDELIQFARSFSETLEKLICGLLPDSLAE